MARSKTMTEKQRMPEIGEYVWDYGKLIAVVDPSHPPEPPPKDWIFEEITARIEIWLNGGLLKEMNSYCHYGDKTAVDNALEEVLPFCEREGIGPEHGLEVVIIQVTSQCRCRPVQRENFRQPHLASFQSIECGSKWGLPKDQERVVWSSKHYIDNDCDDGKDARPTDGADGDGPRCDTKHGPTTNGCDDDNDLCNTCADVGSCDSDGRCTVHDDCDDCDGADAPDPATQHGYEQPGKLKDE